MRISEFEMDDFQVAGERRPLLPARLFERLSQLSGYTWDRSIEPCHSTYNHWHVFGHRHSTECDSSTSTETSSGSSMLARSLPRTKVRPSSSPRRQSSLSESSGGNSISRLEPDPAWVPVIARVSTHVVRLEREFHIMKSIVQTSDPEGNHTIRPIKLIRLSEDSEDTGTLITSIFESPGLNIWPGCVSLSPSWVPAGGESDGRKQIPLAVFLDFATNVCDCLELLHHGLKIIHGEIRGDAFHFNPKTGAVKLFHCGNGARSFDNVLGDGWFSFSRDPAVRNKLQFVAPEQTGRLPKEPDSRTDIYALGVLFWTMLVGRPAFSGANPVDVVHSVLSNKLPTVSTQRMDVPDAISAVIQKMTRKSAVERYNTISSVKRDLSQIAQLLGNGDIDALRTFQIAQHDPSAFFTLPSRMFGRSSEYNEIIRAVEKVSSYQQLALAKAAAQNPSMLYTNCSNPSVSENCIDNVEVDSVSGSSASAGLPTTKTKHGSHSSQAGRDLSQDSHYMRDALDAHVPGNPNVHGHVDPLNSLHRDWVGQKLRRSGRCEVITITGETGIGKTDLLNRVQPAIRQIGYTAVARLDRASRIPFEPFAKILASLLRQIFSERDVTTDYHSSVRAALQPIWPTFHKVLELPEQLLSPTRRAAKPGSPEVSPTQHISQENSISEEVSKNELHSRLDDRRSSDDFFLSNAASKNIRLMETFLRILRVLSQFKVICICIDDLHFADDETLELILNIVKARYACVLILAGQTSELTSDAIKSLFEMETPKVTRIVLNRLTEDEIMDYVAATMHQDLNPMLRPLALVIQEKSRGNQYRMRTILNICYNKNCIWFSWKNTRWESDVDRIFTEFVTPSAGEDLVSLFFKDV